MSRLEPIMHDWPDLLEDSYQAGVRLGREFALSRIEVSGYRQVVYSSGPSIRRWYCTSCTIRSRCASARKRFGL